MTFIYISQSQAMTTTPDWLAVVVATLSAFVIGALWYGPLFGNAWMSESGITEEEIENASMGTIYGTAFVLEVIIATNLAFFLGDSSVQMGALYGFLTGFGWIAMAMGVTYLFSRNTLKLWFIDSFYFVVTLTLMGVIIAAWPW